MIVASRLQGCVKVSRSGRRTLPWTRIPVIGTPTAPGAIFVSDVRPELVVESVDPYKGLVPAQAHKEVGALVRMPDLAAEADPVAEPSVLSPPRPDREVGADDVHLHGSVGEAVGLVAVAAVVVTAVGRKVANVTGFRTSG